MVVAELAEFAESDESKSLLLLRIRNFLESEIQSRDFTTLRCRTWWKPRAGAICLRSSREGVGTLPNQKDGFHGCDHAGGPERAR